MLKVLCHASMMLSEQWFFSCVLYIVSKVPSAWHTRGPMLSWHKVYVSLVKIRQKKGTKPTWLTSQVQPSATSPDAKGYLVALDEMLKVDLWRTGQESVPVWETEKHATRENANFIQCRSINFVTCRSSYGYILWLRRCTKLLCYSPKHFLKDLMRLCESGNSCTQCNSMSFQYFKLFISNFSHSKKRRGRPSFSQCSC